MSARRTFFSFMALPIQRVGLSVQNRLSLHSMCEYLVRKAEVVEGALGAVVGPVGIDGVGLLPAELLCLGHQLLQVFLVVDRALVAALR